METTSSFALNDSPGCGFSLSPALLPDFIDRGGGGYTLMAGLIVQGEICIFSSGSPSPADVYGVVFSV